MREGCMQNMNDIDLQPERPPAAGRKSKAVFT